MSEDEEAKIGALDYIVVIFILILPIVIGVYHGYKRQLDSMMKKFTSFHVEKTNDIELDRHSSANQSDYEPINQVSNYLTANSSMSILPISFSLIATMFSSNTILALPGKNENHLFPYRFNFK
jgi:hypothetical protein